MDEDSARLSAVEMLVAMKVGDVKEVSRFIWSSSLDSIILRRSGQRIVTANADMYGLDRMADSDINDAVEVVRHVNRKLLEEVALFTLRKDVEIADPSKLQLVAVKFHAHDGNDYLGLMVKDEDQWKFTSIPGLTTAVLKYKRLDAAIEDPTIVPSSSVDKEEKPATELPAPERH